ncbi:MAG: OB-fold protein [Chitinophagaceae bacterium]
MRKKRIFLAGAFLCLLVAAWVYVGYNKPRTGVATVEARYTVNAADLYKEFVENENRANEKYNGEVVAVQGTVMEIQKEGDHLLMVLKGDENGGGVSCSFSGKIPTLPAPGENVTIKGRCTGFLMDVNLVDAVLIP